MHYLCLIACKNPSEVNSIMELHNSEWDWFQIGGRWTGYLSGYKPEKDNINIEKCYLCEGTGMRNDSLGKKARLENPDYTCNGCQGKGEKVKWPTEWAKHSGDKMQIKHLRREVFTSHGTTYAFIDLDGSWYDREIEPDIEDAERFINRFIKPLSPETYLVVVDCHN